MSLGRTTTGPSPLDSAAQSLLRAEEAIALVTRATPKNAHAEIQRLLGLVASGRRLRPAFDYEPGPELSVLRRELERLARDLLAFGGLGALHAARAEELELEARLVGHIGTPAFHELAARRFRLPRGELAGRVTTFVDAALAEPVSAPPGVLVLSDDSESAGSLFCVLRRRAAELGLSVRVEVRPRQLAVAATGRGIVAIRPGVPLEAATTHRIALHELLAHALPRERSVHAPHSLFRCGTAGSVEGEEGRALLIEARAGLLGPGRRRELALRHLAAALVRRGADLEETFRSLLGRGADASSALEISVRVHRGSGLAREVVYLPAYHEVAEAFAREPALERVFERGRVGLEAARSLLALDGSAAKPVYSSNSMNTGV